MKKILMAILFGLITSASWGQIRSPRDANYYNGDTYFLEKTNNNFPATQQISIQSGALPQIGQYQNSKACGIRVYNLLRDIGEDTKADSANDMAEIVIKLVNVYQSYGFEYAFNNWKNNEYEIVLLSDDVINNSQTTQWNAVFSTNNTVLDRKNYDQEARISMRDYINQRPGITKITVGIRPISETQPWAAAGQYDCYFAFKGNVKIDEPINVIVENYFSDGSNGGQIKALEGSVPSIESNSPLPINNILTRRTIYTQAIDKTTEGYIFNDTEAPLQKSFWEKRNSSYEYKGDLNQDPYLAIQNIYTTSNEKNYRYRAMMKRLYNVTFSSVSGSSICVDGTTGGNSVTVQKVEGNTVTASALSYVINGIEYTMLNWIKNNVTYPKYTPITINASGTYTAVYDDGKPDGTLLNQHFGTVIGDPIKIYWNDNPDTNVNQYQVWRRVFENGAWGDEILIGTYSRGCGVHEDYGYNLCTYKQNILLEYCVKAYYSTYGTWGAWGWDRVYGVVLPKQEEEKLEYAQAIPVEFKMSNYPNPFNPSTTISYQLPEAGFVTIKVYDISGKEVAELINENKSAGYYNVNFNASRLSSGIYICKIQTGKYSESKKIILTK